MQPKGEWTQVWMLKARSIPAIQVKAIVQPELKRWGELPCTHTGQVAWDSVVQRKGSILSLPLSSYASLEGELPNFSFEKGANSCLGGTL